MKSKMINIKDYDFQDLLDPASNLNDVEFKIVDENSQELGTVRSHKFLLSLLSPVLKKMFMSREKGSIVVEITGPSFISFQTLIQFLYTGDESVITDISCIDDLFDLYCLGDKYELRGSRNLIKEVVSSFKINQENWIYILKGIKKHEITFLFEDLCDILQDKVQGFLKDWTSSESYLENIQESENTEFYLWVKNRIQKWSIFDTGVQTDKGENDKGKVEMKDFNNQVSAELGMQTDEGENDKICKDKEKVEMNEVENVKVEIKDFKNQVSGDMSKLNKALEKIEVLLKKNPDQHSCFGCSMGSFCLDGKPVGYFPIKKAMVKAKSNIYNPNVGVVVYAGDTGIGFYSTTCPYAVIWKKAGVQQHDLNCSNMVFTCGANRQ